MPQACSSRRLVLTLDRATANVLAISSACRGFGERNSKACTCATVRLMPQRVPISPQCRTNRCSIGESGMLVSFPYFLLLQKLQQMATVSQVHSSVRHNESKLPEACVVAACS